MSKRDRQGMDKERITSPLQHIGAAPYRGFTAPRTPPDVVYERVPAHVPVGSGAAYAGLPWRIVLVPAGLDGAARGLEILADIVLGSDPDNHASPDVNLAEWQGYEHGVSRRHLMLRPSRTRLYVMDLRSTNGTLVNGLPLGVGWAYALQDGDMLTLGRLHLNVLITQHP